MAPKGNYGLPRAGCPPGERKGRTFEGWNLGTFQEIGPLGVAGEKRCLRSIGRMGARAGLSLAFGAGADGGPAGDDGGGEAAAGREFSADDAPLRMDRGDDVVENFVDGVFVEDAEVAISKEIHLEGFELDAIFFGHVLDGDGAEVGEAGLGAYGGVFREARGDDIAGELVGPGFERGQFGIDAGAGVLSGVIGHGWSSWLLYRAKRETASC